MKPRKQPVRKCIACQEMTGKKQLVRIVRTPEGMVEADPTGKKSGRGAYVHMDADCIRIIRKARSLERALKTAVPVEIYDLLEQEAARTVALPAEEAGQQP